MNKKNCILYYSMHMCSAWALSIWWVVQWTAMLSHRTEENLLFLFRNHSPKDWCEIASSTTWSAIIVELFLAQEFTLFARYFFKTNSQYVSPYFFISSKTFPVIHNLEEWVMFRNEKKCPFFAQAYCVIETSKKKSHSRTMNSASSHMDVCKQDENNLPTIKISPESCNFSASFLLDWNKSVLYYAVEQDFVNGWLFCFFLLFNSFSVVEKTIWLLHIWHIISTVKPQK